MRSIGQPLVPVLVHEVVHYKTLCLVKVGVYVCCCRLCLYSLYEYHLCLIWREQETFDVSSIVRQLSASCTVRVHFPYLVATAFIRQECYLASALYPGCACLVGSSRCEQCLVAAVLTHDMQGVVALVLFNAVIAYTIYNTLGIG